jgi:hypothetical protein
VLVRRMIRAVLVTTGAAKAADRRVLGLRWADGASTLLAEHFDRVLRHVPDPCAALAEARRVLRMGGTAVFAEPDWDTLIIDCPDQTTARAYIRFITDPVVRNATIGRQFPCLAADVGPASRKSSRSPPSSATPTQQTRY